MGEADITRKIFLLVGHSAGRQYSLDTEALMSVDVRIYFVFQHVSISL